MSIWAFAVKRWQFTLVMFALLIALGLASFSNIARSEDPSFPFPAADISVVWPPVVAASAPVADVTATDPHGEPISDHVILTRDGDRWEISLGDRPGAAWRSCSWPVS